MSPQEMKDAARRFITGVFDEGNLGLVEEMTTEGFFFFIPRPGLIPREAFPEAVEGFRSAFASIRNTYEEQVAEGNVVVTRGTSHITKAETPEAPEKTASVPWVIFTRFEGVRIAENWEVWDEFGLMIQLGAIPDPGG